MRRVHSNEIVENANELLFSVFSCTQQQIEVKIKDDIDKSPLFFKIKDDIDKSPLFFKIKDDIDKSPLYIFYVFFFEI